MTDLALSPAFGAPDARFANSRTRGMTGRVAEIALPALIAASITLAAAVAVSIMAPASTSCPAAKTADPHIAHHRITA